MIAELTDLSPTVLSAGIALSISRAPAGDGRWNVKVLLPGKGLCLVRLPDASALYQRLARAGSSEAEGNVWFQQLADILYGLAEDFQDAADECRVRGGRFPKETP